MVSSGQGFHRFSHGSLGAFHFGTKELHRRRIGFHVIGHGRLLRSDGGHIPVELSRHGAQLLGQCRELIGRDSGLLCQGCSVAAHSCSQLVDPSGCSAEAVCMSAGGLLQGGNVAVEVRAQRGDFLRPSFGEAGEGLLQLGQGRRIPTKGSLECGELAGLVSQIHITQMAQTGQVFLSYEHTCGQGAIHHANAALDFQSAGVQGIQAQLMLLQGGVVADGQIRGRVGTTFQRCDLLPLVRRQDFQLRYSGQHVGKFAGHVA